MDSKGFIEAYNQAVQNRAEDGIPPLALDVNQTKQVIDILKSGGKDSDFCKDLLTNRINPGVDESAKLKAEFLGEIAKGSLSCAAISPLEAVKLLGTMLGGYNVPYLVECLKAEAEVAKAAAEALKTTLLVYDAFDSIAELSKTSSLAKEIMESWAEAEWFTKKAPLAMHLLEVIYPYMLRPCLKTA